MDRSNIKKEKNQSNDDASINSSLKNVDLNRKLEVMTHESTFNSWISVGLGALVGGLYLARIIYLEDESILTYYAGLGEYLEVLLSFHYHLCFLRKIWTMLKLNIPKEAHPCH